MASFIEEFVSSERIVKYFGNNDPLSLLRATLAGFLASSCSCGAIPLAVTLRKRGGSTAAVLTFLMAAP